MFSKIFLTFALATAMGGVLAVPRIVPFDTKADIAIVQDPIGNGDSRIYYQPASGTITEYSLSGNFDNGKTKGTGPLAIVPAAQALQGTPIEAVVFKGYQEVHFFFLSPDGILSEYYYSPKTSWRGGPNCAECVTALRIKVGNRALSATVNPVDNVIAVAFVSAAAPNTLSEAIKRNGRWAVAGLPGL
ncbi:hypothetical protein FPV67DRAFT_1673676 [Lyophyllum atratum]|nr:hypothetical protein FPV67DRAFT_1673676 [Lyophyllum atratum]